MILEYWIEWKQSLWKWSEIQFLLWIDSSIRAEYLHIWLTDFYLFHVFISVGSKV